MMGVEKVYAPSYIKVQVLTSDAGQTVYESRIPLMYSSLRSVTGSDIRCRDLRRLRKDPAWSIASHYFVRYQPVRYRIGLVQY